MLTGLANYRKDDAVTLSVHEQLRTKPNIDDVVCHEIDGDALKDALFIIDNIRENKMRIRWSSANTWEVLYRGRHVCELKIEKGSLTIGHVSDILATRVKYMSSNVENTERVLNVFRNAITDAPEVVLAMS